MVLWLLLALFGLVFSLNFPPVPTQYKVFVAANFNDRNYTLAYQETWDNYSQVLRTEGRFGDSDINDVINFTSGHFYRWNETTCSEILNWTQALLLQPSTYFFGYSNAPKEYVGTEEVRGTPCNLWIQRWNQTFTNANGNFTAVYNITLEYFFGIESNLPMRVELEGTTSNSVNTSTRVYYHIYDWVDWDIGAEYTQFVGATPDYCKTNLVKVDEFPYTRPNSNLAPQPATLPIPTIPSTFSTFIETKLEITNNTNTPSLAEFWWHVDLSSPTTQYEQVGCETPGICGAGQSEKVYITWYYPSTNNTNGTGIQWVYDDESEICTRTKFTTQPSDGPLSRSPLRKVRAGQVPLILANQFPNPRVYAGRSDQRGVPADRFSSSIINTQVDGVGYVYNSSTYFFPDGWSFPGRPSDWLAAQQKIPLRVTNEGTFFANGSWYGYEDIWDFFWFVTSPPASTGGEAFEEFDPTQFGCPMTDPPPFPTVPQHYWGVVSANIRSQNYTLTYEEKYDGSLRLLSTEGRFIETETEDVFDFNANTTIHRFNATDCVRIMHFGPSEYLQPSLAYFYNASSLNPTYVGRKEIREILCDIWITKSADNQTETTYYISADAQVPVRVVIERESDDATLAVYDWANLTFATHPEIGVLPSYCSANSPQIDWEFVAPNSSVPPQPSNSSQFQPPTVPSEFSTFVEIKVDDEGEEELINLEWVVDLDGGIQRERITCFSEGKDCFDGDTAQSLINIYYPANSTHGKSVTQYYLYADGTCYYETHDVLTDAPLSFCPFQALGLGVVGKILTNRYGPLKYEGREEVRGVPADCFSYAGINDEAEPYQSETCFHPQGWAFPGIAGEDINARFPLQIKNEVFLAEGDEEEEDIWDFFYFSKTIEEDDFVPPTNCVYRPPFPGLPEEYAVYVSANIGDHNYSLAFQEMYNPTVNILVTKGRYNTSDQVDVIDLNTGTVVRYNETWCGAFVNVTVNVGLRQSTSFFQIGGDARKVYNGVEEARGRPCNSWVQKFNLTFPQENNVTVVEEVTVEYLFTIDTDLPIRAELTGVRYTGNKASSYHHVYDWVDWDIEPQLNLNFLPDHCDGMKIYNFSLFTQPVYTNLQPQPPALNLPTIPPAFTTLIESKLELSAVTDTPDVAEFLWYVDLTGQTGSYGQTGYERVDCMTEGVCGENELIYITWYFPNNTAKQWIYDETTTLCESRWSNLTQASPRLGVSPLRTFRAGIVPQIMTNNWDPSRTYIGREEIRGVPADRFTVNTNTVNSGVNYNYNSTTYFFPDGWAFPGRPTTWLDAHQKIPMRIQNEGTYGASNGSQIPYEDIWDFFWFVVPNVASDPDYFDVYDPTQFGCNLYDAPPFPQIPKKYKTVVSANFASSNYTLVYEEHWDNDLQILRTEGRFVDYDVHNVIYFTNGSLFQWNDTFCGVALLGTPPYPQLLLPSMSFFNITDQTPVYLGRAEEREILCDAWVIKVNQTFNDSRTIIENYYTATYFFDVSTHLPVRVRLQGYTEDLSTEKEKPFYHVYDWTNLQVGNQANIGALPTYCANAPTITLSFLDDAPNGTVAPLPTDFSSVKVPKISNDFSTLVEVKYETGNLTGLAVYKWYVDFDDAIQRERVDCYTPGLCVDNAATIITWYRPTTDLDIQGTAVQWLITSDGKCIQENFAFPKGEVMVASPFREIRAGTLPSIISNTFGYRRYIGRTEQRGIPADSFTAFGTSKSAFGTYVYNSTLYFYPDGWDFPGRPALLSDQLPLQITNKGLYIRDFDGFTEEYEDRWDLYFWIDDPEVTNTTYDPTQYGCYIPPFPTPSRPYRSFVAANLGEDNYSLAFEEWYSPVNGVLRTEGRFVNYDVYDVLDFPHETHYRYTKNSCVQYENATDAIVFKPSTFFFNSSINKEYLGAEIVRGRPCSVWTSFYTNETSDDYFVINYYFDAVDNTPVRVGLQGSRLNQTANQTNVFYHFYDWVNFINFPTNYKPEEEPADLCKNAPKLPLPAREIRDDYVVAPVTSNVRFPEFPAQFTAIVEAKLQNAPVQDFQWAVDLTGPIKRERVDYIMPNADPKSVITWYQEGIAIQWRVSVNGKCNRIVIDNATALDHSPLAMRAGSIPLIFGNNVTNGWRYGGRSLQRGVPADTFTGEFFGSHPGGIFNYNSTVSFFPQGWGFPGRPTGWLNSTNHQVPLRVVNSGREMDLAFKVTFPYTDIWDFYLFIIAPPTNEDPDIFTPNGDFNCPLTDASTGGGSKKLSGGLIAIIVIIVFLVVGISLYLLYVKLSVKTQTTAHVELQETAADRGDEEVGEKDGVEQQTATVPTTER